MAQEKYDVFISYSSQDQKVTEGICGYLEARGVRCFVAFRDIPRGVVWAGHIANAIDVSRMMVVVFSENFNNSTQTDREIELAAEKPMPILTYRISNNQFTGAKKYYLKNLNWIDAFPDAERRFGVLCENICQLLDINPQTVPVSAQRPMVKEQQPVQTSKQTAMTEIHIETDADCEMYRFSEHLATLHAGADNVVRLNPGTYKLAFRSTKYSDIEITQKYTLAPEIFTDFIEVQLKEKVEAKQRQEEEIEKIEELKKLKRFPYRGDNSKYGFADETGKIVIPCQWKRVYEFDEDLARVENDNGKYGFIDKNGNMVIPCLWKNAENFIEAMACVLDENERFGFIDKAGKVVIPCQWKYASSFSEGLARVRDEYWRSGFIDKVGKVVISCQWKNVESFSDGLAIVKDDNWKYGFIDKTGKVVIPCQWKDAESFSGGLARVKDSNGKEYYIDKTGRVVK